MTVLDIPEARQTDTSEPVSRTEEHVDTQPILLSFVGRIGGLVVDENGTIFVSDATSGAIRRISKEGKDAAMLVAPAKTGRQRESSARLFSPAGLAVALDGALLVADATAHRVCAISLGGSVRVVAGGASGYRDGQGTDAMFRSPSDVAVAADGICYVADTGNDRIRAIDPDGLVTTLAGSIYDYGDGQGSSARFRRPASIDISGDGVCYVADTGNNAIRRVTREGDVTTMAGWPPGGDADGLGWKIGLRWPAGIAVATDRSAWVADHGNGVLRHIDMVGTSATRLRFNGLQWPTAVALRGESEVIVAVVTVCDRKQQQAQLMSFRAQP